MSILDIFKVKKYKEENALLKNKLEELKYDDFKQVQEMIANLKSEYSLIELRLRMDSEKSAELKREINGLEINIKNTNKQIETQKNKLQRIKNIYKSIEYCIENFSNTEQLLSNDDTILLEELVPDITLKLHCMDVKSLRKAYKENEKAIDKVLSLYSSRYTTKSNIAIYNLMVIALRAELQNILYNLKYEKLDSAIDEVKSVCAKYLKIASDGNQSIANTITKFIGEIEYLFINAVKIEYNYYVKKEQAHQEQLALREQMRQEAQERKALEAAKAKIEKEENKFKSEIEKLQEQLIQASQDAQSALQSRIKELEAQLADVAEKKEEITKLQNGKAGYVYVISNLGSFGDNVYKIGMTRRENPQDRVDELGDASVPFKFDVHSFIFSEDAVGLESKLHSLLNDKRVNKVNYRKEFFYSSIDELESLVNEVDPTAEFNRTMIASEFRQSLSTTEMYTTNYSYDTDNEEC